MDDLVLGDARRDSDAHADARFVDADDASHLSDTGPHDVGFDVTDAGPPSLRCAGSLCAEGEDCCLTTGTCFDPTTPGACETPTTRGRCASNSDCDDDELCWAQHCLGEGECRERDVDCGREAYPVCGCDGVDYRTYCDSQRAGVRIVGLTACGEPPPDGSAPYCGRDEQCGVGSTCCFATGQCTPRDCPECCGIPPEGTFYACRANAHCGHDPQFYCDAPIGMCGGVGSCRSREFRCGGEFVPVCGCNGVTYSNLCWAREAQVQVASNGACDAE